MNAGDSVRGMTFHWDVWRRFPTVLPGFIAISFIGHSAAFFIFRVVYPPQASITPPPPAITVLDPSRPDHQALLHWIEAEDPAPVATPPTEVTKRLLQLPYRNSFDTLRTPPLIPPEPPAAFQYPPPRDPYAIIRSADRQERVVQPIAPGSPSRVVLSGVLAGRTIESQEWQIQAKSKASLESPTFLVGVSDRGMVEFVVPQKSCGDAALDAEASAHLAVLKLSRGKERMAWGLVSIEWGPEVFENPPSSQ